MGRTTRRHCSWSHWGNGWTEMLSRLKYFQQNHEWKKTTIISFIFFFFFLSASTLSRVFFNSFFVFFTCCFFFTSFFSPIYCVVLVVVVYIMVSARSAVTYILFYIMLVNMGQLEGAKPRSVFFFSFFSFSFSFFLSGSMTVYKQLFICNQCSIEKKK